MEHHRRPRSLAHRFELIGTADARGGARLRKRRKLLQPLDTVLLLGREDARPSQGPSRRASETGQHDRRLADCGGVEEVILPRCFALDRPVKVGRNQAKTFGSPRRKSGLM